MAQVHQLSSIPELEDNHHTNDHYSLPRRYRRMGCGSRGAIKCSPLKLAEASKSTTEYPLNSIWNVGMAYADSKDGWVIEDPGTLNNVADLSNLVRGFIGKEYSLYRSRQEISRGTIWKQLYITKQIGKVKLLPNYQDICKDLAINQIYELSFYILVTRKMQQDDKDRVAKLIYYCVGETTELLDDVLGIMLKPGANPQISLLIKSEANAKAIQAFLMKDLGFTQKLANNYDGTCIRKHCANGKSDRI